MIDEKDVRTIAIIGAGIMGRGIAYVAALGGFNTILNDVSEELLGTAREQIHADLQKGVEIGKIENLDAPEEARRHILWNTACGVFGVR